MRVAPGIAAVAAAFVVLVPVAGAATVHDPRDARSPLDLRSVSFAQSGETLRFTISTWSAWRTRDIRGGELCALIWTRRPSNAVHDWSVCAKPSPNGRRLLGYVFENGDEELPTLVARPILSRPDARTLTLSFPVASIERPKAIRWRVRTFVKRFDYAPARTLVREALR